MDPRRISRHSAVAGTAVWIVWQLLADSGVGLYVLPAKIVPGPSLGLGASGPEVLALQEALAAYGYAVSASSQYDSATRDVVAAFQRHFRPARVDGIADPSTLTTLHNLLTALKST